VKRSYPQFDLKGDHPMARKSSDTMPEDIAEVQIPAGNQDTEASPTKRSSQRKKMEGAEGAEAAPAPAPAPALAENAIPKATPDSVAPIRELTPADILAANAAKLRAMQTKKKGMSPEDIAKRNSLKVAPAKLVNALRAYIAWSMDTEDEFTTPMTLDETRYGIENLFSMIRWVHPIFENKPYIALLDPMNRIVLVNAEGKIAVPNEEALAAFPKPPEASLLDEAVLLAEESDLSEVVAVGELLAKAEKPKEKKTKETKQKDTAPPVVAAITPDTITPPDEVEPWKAEVEESEAA
jgi:hypothetical protein